MSTNATSRFLQSQYNWSRAAITLEDVHPLHGGVRVHLPGWTMSLVFITRVAPGGEAVKYRIPIPWDLKDSLCQQFVDADFVTIETPSRLGIPDEARPTITLANADRESHTVAKWHGDRVPGFDLLYEALLALAAMTADHRPMQPPLGAWAKGLIMAGLVAVVVGTAAVSFWLAQAIIVPLWPQRLMLLTVGLLVGLLLLVAGLRGLAWYQRHLDGWDRTFTHPLLLAVFNLAIMTGLVGLVGLVTAVYRQWRFDELQMASLSYATFAYAALLTVVGLLVLAAVAGRPLLTWLESRWR